MRRHVRQECLRIVSLEQRIVDRWIVQCVSRVIIGIEEHLSDGILLQFLVQLYVLYHVVDGPFALLSHHVDVLVHVLEVVDLYLALLQQVFVLLERLLEDADLSGHLLELPLVVLIFLLKELDVVIFH